MRIASRLLRPRHDLRTRLLGAVCAAVLAGAAAMPASGPASAQETVPTRGGVHPDYGRIVFDWPRRVAFETETDGATLTVRFPEALSTDFGAVLGNLDAYLRSAELLENGRAVRFSLAQPVSVTSFRSGDSIAIDLRPDAGPATAAAPDPALPAVRVRVGQHPTYIRLVFDWTDPTPYTVGLQDGALVARFQRPATVDTAALAGRLPQGFGRPQVAASDSETVFVLPVAGGSTVRDLVSGDKVVFDVTLGSAPVAPPAVRAADLVTPAPETPSATAPETADAAPAPAPEEPVQTAQEEPAQAEAPEPPAEETDTAEAAVPPAQTAAAEPGTEQADASGVSDNGGPISLAPPSDDSAGTSAEEAAEAEARRILDAEDAEAEADAAQVADETDTNAGVGTRARVAETDLQGPPTAERLATEQAVQDGTIQFKRDNTGREVSPDGPPPVSFSFDWPEEAGAAVYRRGDYVWVVFDRRAQIDLNPLRQQGAPLIDRIEQLPINTATVLRLRTRPGIYPVVRLEGFNWVVDFRNEERPPQNQVTIQAEADPDAGPKLTFPTASPGNLITVPDPDVGDTLLVATYREPGFGVAGTRTYPEFRVLSSAQGVVVEPNGDNVLFERSFDGFSVSGTEGLHISAVSPEAPASTQQSYSSRRLFDFKEWVRGGPGDFLTNQYNLLQAVTEVPEESRIDARLDLVRFYAARARGPEAKGVMRVVESADDALFKKAELRALRGVVGVLSRDFDAARQDLSDPRLDGFAEAALWRGAMLAEIGEWIGAAEQFKVGDSILRDYPYPLRAYLALLRVDAALSTEDTASASRWLDELDSSVDQLSRGQYSRLRFHQGRIAHFRRDLELADDFWTELTEGTDRKYAARAEFQLIKMQREQDAIDDDEVISRLEKLRFKWRGDGFEFNVLRRLGKGYIDKGDYLNGLDTWRLAVTYFAEQDASRDLAQDMTDLFRRLYIDGEADRMPPLRALALYDEFRELTPAGSDGDLLIELLANRLIDVDLLDRASALLDQQIEFRLKEQGREKARIGTKLAFVRLLNNDPVGAVEALRKTNFPQIDRQLDDDRRRLEAKAMFELDRPGEAIKLLAGDTSIDADVLRQDIFRRAENWTEAAKVLQRLSGDPPGEEEEIPDENARHVVNWAVALKLDQDEAGLNQVRELYGPAMNISAFRDVFNYIVAPNDQGGANLEASLQQLSATDGFNAFMENYRDRLLTPVIGSDRQGPVTSGTNALQDS